MIQFRNIYSLLFLSLGIFFCACSSDTTDQSTPVNIDDPIPQAPAYDGPARFSLVSPDQSGVNFSNLINETYDYNILNFEYLYNGGGVAIGDINNDGLPDLYFTGTFIPNKLYLNKGNLQFEDITDAAGVAAADGFKTGVTMVDINADGWLDIYVCRTSKADDGNKDNRLFLNNKNNTFTESAAKFGLKDNSNSNHANFFDYDLDGDLDLYLLNHRLGFKDATRMRLQQNPDGTTTRLIDPQSPFESDRLYRNNGNGSFTEVTEKAGLSNSAFGLSATVSDLNADGYPDIYVANDYIEPDYVYINNGNGTFTDRYAEYLRHSSQNSMGCDIADFNNDGLVDIVVLDMVAEEHTRYKKLMNVMQLERYNALVQYGYGHQAGRNMLQLNNGNGSFSEIGQLAGMAATDWSWGALFADFDNDGYKDLYIGNGYKRDVTNLDYMTYLRDSIERSGGVNQKRYPDLNEFLKIIPSTPLQNYMFRNRKDFTFEQVADAWGLPEKSFSNGSAYGDLDGDGDIDLVVNNIGDPSFVYENKSAGISGSNYLQVNLQGPKKNTFGVGTKITVAYSDVSQFQELTPTRGFFSSSQHLVHFGLGSQTDGITVEVTWPDGKGERRSNVSSNQKLDFKYADAKKLDQPIVKQAPPIFEEATQALGIDYVHEENEYQDFNRERLIPHQLSKFGPKIAVGDVNGDGREDFFIGGAMQSAGALFIQSASGTFSRVSGNTWEGDKKYEDVDAVFLDADGDKDLDLYVVSGGAAANPGSDIFQDRLYLNDGQGAFSKSDGLPKFADSGACVSAMDFDGDGDTDIFVGGRLTPGAYPSIPNSHLLQNDGGTFTDVSAQVSPVLAQAGMFTDLLWVDLNGDQKAELVTAGEWMPISVFSYDGQAFRNTTAQHNLQHRSGWWNCLQAADFDGDGDLDLAAGNLGTNTRLRTSVNAPLTIFAKDFDNNKQIDPIMAYSHQGKLYPFAGRDQLAKQVPKVKKKFPRYAKYANAPIEEVFSKEELKDAQKMDARILHTCYFENTGGGKMKLKVLPTEAQFAPATTLFSDDFDKDGHTDLLLAGNTSTAEPESGVYDAGNGVLLKGDGKGGFSFVGNKRSGLWASGEARDVQSIQLADGKRALLVSNNDGALQAFIY